LNKWDLVKAAGREKQAARQLVDEARGRIFFLEYAPVLITSASTGENVNRLFALIEKLQHAAGKRIRTGVLNRLLRQAFEANPPPMVKGRRLKLFYATQPRNGGLLGRRSLGDGGHSAERTVAKASPAEKSLPPLEFVLFVNDPDLINEVYRRYLEARIRKTEPYPGLPIIVTLRPRGQKRRS